jgi:hypothetical protein
MVPEAVGALGRTVEEGCWRLAAGQRKLAESQWPEQQQRVDKWRAEFLEKRRERMQVETLLDQAAAVERTGRDRRDQRSLDDWYQTSMRRGNSYIRGIERGRPEQDKAIF